MTPISAKKTNITETLAALKRRLRNTLTSIIGWSERRSQAMNAAMIAAPIANAPRIVALVQPLLRSLDQRPDDRRQARDREPEARDVEPRRLGVARVGDQ